MRALSLHLFDQLVSEGQVSSVSFNITSEDHKLTRLNRFFYPFWKPKV